MFLRTVACYDKKLGILVAWDLAKLGVPKMVHQEGTQIQVQLFHHV